MSLRNPYKLGVRLEVVDVETAVEMVDFVLQRPGEQAVALNRHRQSIAIDGADHSTDYAILPVTVRLEWRGSAGDSALDLHTVLVP